MGTVLLNGDGLDQEVRKARTPELQTTGLLEEDRWRLLNRLREMAGGIRYYNQENCPDGYWSELWAMQPVFLLAEIQDFDTEKWEEKFSKQHTSGRQQLYTDFIRKKLEDWRKRWEATGWKKSLEDVVCLKEENTRKENALGWESTLQRVLEDNQEDQSVAFYGMLSVVKSLQQQCDVVLEELLSRGNLDPAFAVGVVFLQNYSEVVKRFNQRWEMLPAFYYERILQEKCRPVSPERVWLSLQKGEGEENIRVEAGTRLLGITGEQRCLYQTRQPIAVTALQLAKLMTVFAEEDEERFPAARLGFVTAVKEKEISVAGDLPASLFAGKGVRTATLGMVIESPMLVLREGFREVVAEFYMMPESIVYFEALLAQTAIGGKTAEECLNKILKDAFLLKISVTEGWKQVYGHLRYDREKACFVSIFRMQESFPATEKCEETVHGVCTTFPALQMLVNPEAWLFACAWVQQMQIRKIRLQVSVKGARRLKVHNKLGEQDISIPFYPFGVQVEKGAWMAVGNYEMALKPVYAVSAKLKWSQLPVCEQGLWEYYKEYGENIDNSSFVVRTEWLSGKRWKMGEIQTLFQAVSPHSCLQEESRIALVASGEISVPHLKETDYEYGKVPAGFMRIVLESPEMGFGDRLYRELFANTMIYNSRHKNILPLPKEPIVPVIEELELDYTAADEFYTEDLSKSVCRLYYIRPMIGSQIQPVSAAKSVPWIAGTQDKAMLLLGFRGAGGLMRIRFFVDFEPEEAGLENKGKFDAWRKEEEREMSWKVLESGQWVPLRASAVLEDTTACFTENGIVELDLPEQVNEKYLDDEGILWVAATWNKKVPEKLAVRGFYTNAVEVEAVDAKGGTVLSQTIWRVENHLPGVVELSSIAVSCQGQEAEQPAERNLRMAYQISHRNRAVLPRDFERMVLMKFPSIGKVKCFPWKTEAHPAIILVVIAAGTEKRCPLCSKETLRHITDYLKPLLNPFANLKVINPVYEEMIVRCRVELAEEFAAGDTLQRLQEELDACIAPWLRKKEMPILNYVFSLQALRDVLIADAGVVSLSGLSVLHVTCQGKKKYSLKEYTAGETAEILIRPSAPWCIGIPARHHQMVWAGKETWLEQAGVGELEIGDTFIINE